MPFGRNKRVDGAHDKAPRTFKLATELQMAVCGEDSWAHLVRERRWWRRTSVCERVGHCDVAPLSFLPMPGDVRVAVHTPAAGFAEATAAILVEFGDWFEAETEFVRRCLTPESYAVDIGANHGVFALPMAKIASSGRVWAFEPASTTADLIETSRNANELHNLTVCRAAVSDTVGVARFTIADAGSEYNHLVLDSEEHPSQGCRSEEVQVTTLDECMRRFAWQRIDLIKIDAEGAELQIVLGGKHFFAAMSPLVMFEAEHAGKGFSLPVSEALSGLGYSMFRLVPGLGALVRMSPDELAQRAAEQLDLNMFACKEDCAAQLAERGLVITDWEDASLSEHVAKGQVSFAALPYACKYARIAVCMHVCM